MHRALTHADLTSADGNSAALPLDSAATRIPPKQQLPNTVCPGGVGSSQGTPRPASAKPARVDGINATHAAALPGQTPHRGGNDPTTFQEITVDPVLAEILPNSWAPFLPKQDGSDGFLEGRVCHRHSWSLCSGTTS